MEFQDLKFEVRLGVSRGSLLVSVVYRTLRCLVFPMTLVVNAADPLTEDPAADPGQGIKARLASMQQEALAKHAEHLAKERQATLVVSGLQSMAQQVHLRAAKLKHSARRQQLYQIAPQPKGNIATAVKAEVVATEIWPTVKAEVAHPLASKPLVEARPPKVKAKGSHLAKPSPKATWKPGMPIPPESLATQDGEPLVKATAVKAKAKGGFPIPDRETALANIRAVFPSRYSAAKLGDEQLKAKAATTKASSQILTSVKTFLYTSFIFRHFIFRHFVFRHFIYRGFCL